MYAQIRSFQNATAAALDQVRSLFENQLRSQAAWRAEIEVLRKQLSPMRTQPSPPRSGGKGVGEATADLEALCPPALFSLESDE